jgi:hypothetical protein
MRNAQAAVSTSVEAGEALASSGGAASIGAVSRGSRRPGVLLTVVGALMALLAIGATSARAEPIQFTFDHGVINLNDEDGVWANIIDPSLEPPDPPALITGEYDELGSFSAPAAGLFFPRKRIENLETGNALLPFVDADIDISAEGPLTGSFDPDTGDANVIIPAHVLITVYSAGSPSSVARCSISGFDLDLETVGTMNDPGDPEAEPPRPPAQYDASPFAPPEGEGAKIATWESLPNSQIEGGSLGSIVCPALDDLLGGPGGVWLSGVASEDLIVPPTAAPTITSSPPASTTATSASFNFTAGAGETEPISGFQCRLDGGDWADCSSGSQSYANLGVGGHNFRVRAGNDAGPGPEASFSWSIQALAARLSALRILPRARNVKRGRARVFRARIRNTGNGPALGVRICLRAPKRLVRGARCARVGRLAPGRTATRRFRVFVKPKARRGQRIALRFRATANQLPARQARARVRVR